MKHFQGGTIRKVMAQEVKRVMKKYRDSPRQVMAASVELGVHHKTLRVWLKEWEELEPTAPEMVEVLQGVFGGKQEKS